MKRTLTGSMKVLMTFLGCVCVVLGVIGIFLPLLPTTPFILLAAWLFSRSSERFHNWLRTHKQLGPIITIWESGEGLERKVRTRVITILWAGMILSMWIVGKIWAVVLLTSIGTAVTAYLLKLPIKE
mgnify:CR=1 FL=1